MNILETTIPGVLLFEPRSYPDARGLFLEAYQRERYCAAGLPEFVQDNFTVTRRHALRGLHYQIPRPQGKLVWAITGEIYDVAVDLRQDSPSFGCWYGCLLNAENRRQLYLPPGTAHGFCALSASADVIYKCTDYYFPEFNRVLRWDDPMLAIPWPVAEPLLSPHDAAGQLFTELPYFEGPLDQGLVSRT